MFVFLKLQVPEHSAEQCNVLVSGEDVKVPNLFIMSS